MTEKIFVSLIRHGQTPGNAKKRYIGRTDEPLSEAGRKELEGKSMPAAKMWAVSPYLRCRQTCEILMRSYAFADPKPIVQIIQDFRECDFGLFENQNYLEMQDLPAYQTWVESGGMGAFPGGETPEGFQERCCQAFEKLVRSCFKENITTLNLVVHGGTIMSIMDRFCAPQERGGRAYYDWYAANGCGYTAAILQREDGMPVLADITAADFIQEERIRYDQFSARNHCDLQ